METHNQKRVVVVTGANAGIGRSVADQLAVEGYHVVAVSRSAEKGRAAAAEVRASAPDATVDVVQGDLSTIAGTRDLAERLLSIYPRIHVLVNNAGVWMTERKLNADGLEITFMVNHVAPFLLSTLLLGRLKESAPSRIVMVNAGLYANGAADLDQLPTGENFNRFKTYMHSKLLNVYATLELAQRLEGSGVTVNALHPGVIRTNLGDSRGPIGMLVRIAKRFWAAPEDGAKPVVNLAVNPALEGVTGRYFNEMEEMALADNARDAELQRRIWDLTVKISGLEASVQPSPAA